MSVAVRSNVALPFERVAPQGRRCPAILYDLAMIPDDPALDAEHAAFIQGPVSIHAATRNAANQTTVTRCLGCRVSEDRRRVTVLLSAAQSTELLADLRADGTIAVVFSHPSSHRAVQLKAVDAVVASGRAIGAVGAVGTVAPAAREATRFLEAYRKALAAEVGPLGFPEGFVRALLAVTPDDVVAVTFTPTAAFVQTPGPKAGAPLGSPEPSAPPAPPAPPTNAR